MIFLAAGAVTVTIGFLATLAAGAGHTATSEADHSSHTPTDEEPVDELEGVYPATQAGTSTMSLYEPGADTVAIEHDKDGYYNVEFRAADGTALCHGHRPAHRIERALEGAPGYDYFARDDAAAARQAPARRGTR